MRVVFLCTGNTCRSPMAAALFSRLAGVEAESAGLFAGEGQPAAAHMRTLAEEYRVDLSGHKARQVTEEMLAQADFIVCLSAAHAMQIKAHTAQEKIRVLGGGIADPFGGSIEAYKACVEEMRAALPALLKDLRCPCEIVDTREEHLSVFARLQREVFHPPASLRRLRERFAAPCARMYTAMARGETAGYISFDEITDEVYIDDVAVFPKYQRQGFGSALLARAETGAILRGCGRIRLEVRESAPARALYAGRGYRETGRRKNFYECPDEDAILMELVVR